jgi:hypothetical protein
VVRSDEDKGEVREKAKKDRLSFDEIGELERHWCQDEMPGKTAPLFSEEKTQLYLRKEHRYYEITYCPHCGRHKEEIALLFADAEDLEVVESGS